MVASKFKDRAAERKARVEVSVDSARVVTGGHSISTSVLPK